MFPAVRSGLHGRIGRMFLHKGASNVTSNDNGWLRDAFPDVLRGLISGEEAQDIPAEPVDVTPKPAQQRVAPPVDHIALFRTRLEKCPDVACVDSQWSLWQTTIARAQEAGRPISEEVQEAVQDMIADRREELDKKSAEAPVDGVPA